MKQVRLYIIEEHRAVCQALVTRLGAEPSVAVLGSGGDLTHGLQEIHRLRPDVVLLASKSNRREDALTTIRAISLLLADSAPGIIVLTPYLDEWEREQVLATGAQRYLLKDIDTARLVREIKAVSDARAVSA